MNKILKLARIMMLSVIVIVTSVAAAPAPEQPNVTFTLVQGLPTSMQVGDSYTVVVEVTSDGPFLFSQALPSMYYPGARYIVGGAGDHSQGGTSTTLQVTFVAVGSTAQLPNGVAPISVFAVARFQGGIKVVQRFDFFVSVP